jgi:hypothetical protein
MCASFATFSYTLVILSVDSNNVIESISWSSRFDIKNAMCVHSALTHEFVTLQDPVIFFSNLFSVQVRGTTTEDTGLISS